MGYDHLKKCILMQTITNQTFFLEIEKDMKILNGTLFGIKKWDMALYVVIFFFTID